MSLVRREDETDDDAEPEDLPNLVRREVPRRGPLPLHPAMDRTAGFFRAKKSPILDRRGFFAEQAAVEARGISRRRQEMTKRKLALAVALAAVGSMWMGRSEEHTSELQSQY